MVIVVFRYCFILLILSISTTTSAPWCHESLVGTKGKRWTLCVKRTKDAIQINILNLFMKNDHNNSQALAIGFPKQNYTDKIIGFLQVVTEQATVKLMEVNQLNCTMVSNKEEFGTVTVSCDIPSNLGLNAKSMVVYYSVLEDSKKISFEMLMKTHESLTFNFHQQPLPETNMINVQDYGKSMAAIVGIAVLLTTLITVTVCCCCKKHSKVDQAKAKDVSVAFYRDNGEAESESSDEDENVAFIQKNHDRNSNV